jgi:hypothetical protein
MMEKRARKESVVMRACVAGQETPWMVFPELQVCLAKWEKQERREETVYRVFQERLVRKETSAAVA